jgi:hypothetical protein
MDEERRLLRGRSRGSWYPTRVIRKTSNFSGQQATRFVLDFRAEIPDALFRPAE